MSLPYFTSFEWLQAAFAAVFCGVAKAGISGVGLLTVLLMANLIPGQASSGVVLPLLIAADILAASRYRKHVQWGQILRVGTPMLFGVALGTWFMAATQTRSASFFNHIVAGLVLLMCAVQLIRQHWPSLDERLPHSLVFAWIVGLIGGVATMLANAAGPISTLYLLILGLGKKEFIHTQAWWFLILNILKLPFSASLGLINLGSLSLNAVLLPPLALGFFLGGKLVERIPQQAFAQIVMVFAVCFAIYLLAK